MALNKRFRRKKTNQVDIDIDLSTNDVPSPNSKEIKTYFGQCKCCLNYAYLKNMWDEQSNKNGKSEIYGKMLVECFSISWNIKEKTDNKICELCILKLREAVRFKELVLESQKEFEDMEESAQYEIKIDEFNSVNEQIEDSEYYKDVQFLDEDMMQEEGLEMETDDTQDSQPDTKTSEGSKSKKFKKYKQYSRETLIKAVEAVKSDQMTPWQASVKFKVPRGTLCTTLRGERTGTVNAIIMADFFKEISAILKHTNATPFRSKGNHYYCLYCRVEEPYRHPDKLRDHTHSVHKDKDTQIEFVMRPYYTNEILKLDVKDLTCVTCNAKESWLDMIDHLIQHDVNLEMVNTRIVPYELGVSELNCVLCDYNSVYTLMDAHMNTHFKNYICGECGDTFIQVARFNSHAKTHEIGIYSCKFCAKSFTRETYRKKHIDMVHKKKLPMKCWYCDVRFASEGTRRSHAETYHSDMGLSSRECKVCKKNLASHLYSQHFKRCSGEVEYRCDVCGKEFIRQRLLDDHKLRHTGVKSFQCDICLKLYFSETAVSMHKRYKHNEFRTMCETIDIIK